MKASISSKRGAVVSVLSLLVVATPFAAPFASTASAQRAITDGAFEQVWSRTDKPVEQRMAARSWMWGPEPFYGAYEPYAEGPNGQHLVTYFDKSRMEINDPNGNRNTQWFVTNGLLVVDMIAGKIQAGNNMFIPAKPAAIPVAGDAGSPNSPTYAALAGVASLNGDRRAPNRTGQNIREGLGRAGNVGVVDNLAGFAKYGQYEPTLGHNIPDVFWSFLNQKGTVFQNGRYETGTVVDWLFAMGYPITEPYWIQIKVGNDERWVLMQAFQRRILTYSPHNPEGWKVEMANVGRAYYDWRYQAAVPTATPVPVTQASIAIDPTEGNTATQITVTGRAFPAHAAVTIGIENPGANYFRGLATVAVKADGTFVQKINLPADAARLGQLTVTATANGGAIRATQTYRLTYDAAITVSPAEVVVNGVFRVHGEGFPARTDVNLGIFYPGSDTEWLGRQRTNDNGAFDAQLGIGGKPVGAQYSVVATAAGNVKAVSAGKVTVIGQPSLQIQPSSGPAGVFVTMRGFNWPANRNISVGIRGADSRSEGWAPDPAVTDAAGNFTFNMWVGREYNEQTEVRLIAAESRSTIRLESAYRIIRQTPPTVTPVPQAPAITISPSVLASGQQATITGSRFPAGATVQVGIGYSVIEESLGVARADGNGNFSHSFILSARWQNAGRLLITAIVPGGPAATVPVHAAANSGKVVPMGLPMEVQTLHYNGHIDIKAKASGWQPGKAVNVSVISADGSVNVPMGSTVVKEDGTFGVSIGASGPWYGRTDLGIRAATTDNQQYSVRFLPLTDMVKVDGNRYIVRGQNWAPNTRVTIDLNIEGTGEETIGAATTDALGNFETSVTLPRLPGTNQNDIVIRSKEQPYRATFDL